MCWVGRSVQLWKAASEGHEEGAPWESIHLCRVGTVNVLLEIYRIPWTCTGEMEEEKLLLFKLAKEGLFIARGRINQTSA